MSLEGQLEDLSLADIFQIIHLSKKTGTLTIENSLNKGRIVFHDGQILYASLQSREKLGERLLRQRLINKKDLDTALRIQKDRKNHEPLGAILADNKMIEKDVLEEILREQLKEVVYEFLSWEKGIFKFDPEQNMQEIPPGSSISPEYLLLEGTRLRDEDMSGIEIGSKMKAEYPVETGHIQHNYAELLVSMIEEMTPPVVSTEVLLMILRFAGEVLNRAVLLIVKEDHVAGFGQVGISNSGADQKIKELWLPLDELSVISDAVNAKKGYKGVLSENDWNNYLTIHIGEGIPSEVFVAPVIAYDKVIAVLYGDNLPDRKPIKDTAALEAFIKIVGVMHVLSLQPLV